MEEKKFNVCVNTTNNLITIVHATSWQKAKSMLKKEGYEGKFILEQTSKSGFKITNITI